MCLKSISLEYILTDNRNLLFLASHGDDKREIEDLMRLLTVMLLCIRSFKVYQILSMHFLSENILIGTTCLHC